MLLSKVKQDFSPSKQVSKLNALFRWYYCLDAGSWDKAADEQLKFLRLSRNTIKAMLSQCFHSAEKLQLAPVGCWWNHLETEMHN